MNKLSEYLKHPSAPLVTFAIGLLLGLLLAGDSEASGRHHEVTNISEVTNTYSSGNAIAIATAQHHFDFGTHSFQGSVGAGHYQNDTAVSFAIGKRFGRMLINGSVGSESGNTSVGAGINWRF